MARELKNFSFHRVARTRPWCALLISLTLVAPIQALPTLVTPAIQDPIFGRDYNASVMVAAQLPVAVSVTGLPAGLTATHNGSGTVAISGMPTESGDGVISITASDVSGNATWAVPIRVQRFSRMVTSVAAGGGHTCLVLRGGVQCWGRNSSGQLGDGSSVWSLTAVRALPEQSGATAVVAGYDHTCAIVQGGVQCWGDNSLGQLGDGSDMSRLSPVWTIPPNSNVSSLSTSLDTTCAVRAGAVQCWGDNSHGQVGSGTSSQVHAPTNVASLSAGASSVSTGGNHTCAAVFGGVHCWGSNWYGETGSPAESITPQPFQVIPSNSGANVVAVGSEHSCAIASGALKCWGRNSPYNIFSADPSTPFSTAVPVTVLASGTVLASADAYRTCAVTVAATLCWGQGFEIGAVPVVQGATQPSAISLGNSHRCIVLNGSVECWGGNNGRLGGDDGLYRTRPTVVFPTGSGVTSVSTRDGQGCAAASGGVKCWGSVPYAGPAPYRDYENSWLSIQRIAQGAGITSVAVGGNVCASGSGQTLCWGDNSQGQLGIGNSSPVAAPVSPVLPASAAVNSLSLGDDTACAVVGSNGYCWGSNRFTGLSNVPQSFTTLPTLMPPMNGTHSRIAIGYGHLCAVVAGGVTCAGDNTYGQVGISNFFTGQILPPVAQGAGATEVLANYHYSCALVDGGLKCWGSYPGKPYLAEPVAQIFPAGSAITGLAIGYQHACFLQNRTVKCWGSNSGGELGTGNFIDQPSPTAASTVLESDSPIALVSPSCVIVNGGVACWGANGYGGLGLPFANALTRVVSAVPFVGVPATLIVAGNGVVTSDNQDVRCDVSCAVTLEKGSTVRLFANPASGYAFVGWSGGPCSGTGACVVLADTMPSVTATFVPVTPLDVTVHNASPRIRSLADALIIVRYLQGVRGEPLVHGLVTADAGRTDPASVTNFLDSLRPQLDIDGDGTVSAADGVLLLRYLLGVRGDALVVNVASPQASRSTGGDVGRYIESLLP